MCSPRSSACYISWKRPENCPQRARSLGPQSTGCISTKSFVRQVNDEKMNIGTMGKHFYKPPTNWLIGKVLVAAQQTDDAKALLKKKNTDWLMLPQVELVGFNLLMSLLISHLRMLLDNSLRGIWRRTCNGILNGKSVPLKEEY